MVKPEAKQDKPEEQRSRVVESGTCQGFIVPRARGKAGEVNRPRIARSL